MKKIFLAGIFLILVISFASAISLEELLGKNKTCEILNISENSCNKVWCESVNDGNYSDEKELCILTINNTIILNNTNQTNSTQLNISELEEKLGLNFSNGSLLEQIENITKSNMEELNKNLTSNFVTKSEFNGEEKKSSDDSGNKIIGIIFAIGFFVLIVIIIVLLVISKKQDNNGNDEHEGKRYKRTIHAREELEDKERIRELEKKLKKEKSKKSNSSEQDKSNDSNEDDDDSDEIY